MAEISILEVLLHGESIGTLTHLGGDRTLFAFNEAYIAQGNRAVLGLGFKDKYGNLITEFPPTQTSLLPFFSNLLPEGHLRAYLAERAAIKPAREFHLIWMLGADLPGAVTIRSIEGVALLPPSSGDDDDDDGDRRNALRFSLAGVQLKFSAINEHGLTIPAKGVGGSWIVKLPSARFEAVPENEYAMMTLARLVGIDVPAVQLIDVDAINNLPGGIGALKGQALAIERFDRPQGAPPVHIEDFAQVFGVYPAKKYDRASYRNIAAVIAKESGDKDVAEFVRRVTFSVLIGNADMHLKNWSLIYPDRRNAALAPAYDLVSTIAFLPDENAALNFSRTKRFDGYTEDELKHLAAKALLPEKLVLDTARETVSLFHERWRAERKHLPLSKHAINTIEAHLKTIPLA